MSMVFFVVIPVMIFVITFYFIVIFICCIFFGVKKTYSQLKEIKRGFKGMFYE